MHLTLLKNEAEQDKQNKELYQKLNGMGKASMRLHIDKHIQKKAINLNKKYVQIMSSYEDYLVDNLPHYIINDKNDVGTFYISGIHVELHELFKSLRKNADSNMSELKSIAKDAFDKSFLLDTIIKEYHKKNTQTHTKDEQLKNFVPLCIQLSNIISLIVDELNDKGEFFFTSFFNKEAYYKYFRC